MRQMTFSLYNKQVVTNPSRYNIQKILKRMTKKGSVPKYCNAILAFNVFSDNFSPRSLQYIILYKNRPLREANKRLYRKSFQHCRDRQNKNYKTYLQQYNKNKPEFQLRNF